MTGFASLQGGGQGLSWTWELRGVNGKGLDLRLRSTLLIERLDLTKESHGQALPRPSVHRFCVCGTRWRSLGRK